MIDKAYVLTDEERSALNSTSTTEADRMRLYGRDLRATAQAYAVAADAPGLRKDAARYLYLEALRLTGEGGAALDRADELDAAQEETHDPSGRGCALAGRGDPDGCRLCLAEIAARDALWGSVPGQIYANGTTAGRYFSLYADGTRRFFRTRGEAQAWIDNGGPCDCGKGAYCPQFGRAFDRR